MSIGRNSPCHCGSGKKYKKCCLSIDESNKSNILRQKSADQLASLDRALAGVIPNNDDPEENSPEFSELENWVDEYLSTIDENHPFRKYLMDSNITHFTLLKIAKEEGYSDYYKKAEPLY
ncbi:SEC-C metal-binding domain-containing protein, partial [Microbulbifer epialgicus]